MVSSVPSAAADKEEAAHRVAQEVERLRGLPYDDLAELAGSRQRREMRTASGRSLDLETQVAWDDERRETLYVTLNVWTRDSDEQPDATEVAHDEFALSPDGRGGLVGPVRRREAAEHTAAGHAGRYLSSTAALALVWAAFGWANAGERHFSEGSIGLAWANTGLWIFVLGLNFWRWRKARRS